MNGLEQIKKENKEADETTKGKIELNEGITIRKGNTNSVLNISYNGKTAKITTTVLRLIVQKTKNEYDFSSNQRILDLLNM